MKYALPVDHGMSVLLAQNWLFSDSDGQLALNDVQYEALSAGVARGHRTGQRHVVFMRMDRWCCPLEVGGNTRELKSRHVARAISRSRMVLQGMAEIGSAACDARIPKSNRPAALRLEDSTLKLSARLPRAIKRLFYRLTEGLPDNVLWMVGLCTPGSPYLLRREEILALNAAGLTSPEALMQGSADADAARTTALIGVKAGLQAKANWLRDACRIWKANQSSPNAKKRAKKMSKRAPDRFLLSSYWK
ncbi:hypothetical protein FHW18_004552 [Pigmentiphaga litoralis]|uniref:Uncharacterized protein n=1 Tax=Pigmentiphaga litoralis TaxID=516702 RepID=A0A7Y9LQ06_9BURK|nr:hypothetical protein [Pigmentiphaga litoralis]NYE85245.1 hypothetical protein [Pigmentiphaga litoralis]